MNSPAKDSGQEQFGYRSVRIQGVLKDADLRIRGAIFNFHKTYGGAAIRAAKSRQPPPPTTIPAQMWNPTINNEIRP
jgi:hypothetical protein